MDDATCKPAETATYSAVEPKHAGVAAPATPVIPATRAGLLQVREALQQLLAEGRADEALTQFMHLLVALFDDNSKLQHRVAALLKAQFGSKSERISAEQLNLVFDALEQAGPGDDEVIEGGIGPVDPDLRPPEPEPKPDEPPPRPPQRRPGRNKLPGHIPHETIHIAVPDAERPCPVCGIERGCIGHETSEQLDWRPASFVVQVFEREKLACAQCQENVVVAPKAAKVISGGLCGTGLASCVLLNKYCDALPLHRQAAIFARQGVAIAETTLCSWVGQLCSPRLLGRVADAICQQALACSLIGADDTRLPTLDPKHENGIKKAHLWQYLGYDDEGRPKWPAFRYTEDWTAKGPAAFLAGYTGKLQGDGYAGWVTVTTAVAAMVLFGCWAHLRRKFVEALDARELAAGPPLALIRQLYAIEAKARDNELNAEQRRQLRQAEALPILDKLAKWRDEKRGKIRPTARLYDAWTYLDNQWPALRRYAEDGQVPIDNNWVENHMRSIGVGRRNWLFAGSDNGGASAAVMYTIYAACRLHSREPWGYVRDVLDALARREQDAAVEDLLPDRFGPKVVAAGPVV